MKASILSLIFFCLICRGVFSEKRKTVEKRQSCQGGNCGGGGGFTPCIGGNCGRNPPYYPYYPQPNQPYTPYTPCGGGNCGGNIDISPPDISPPVRPPTPCGNAGCNPSNCGNGGCNPPTPCGGGNCNNNYTPCGGGGCGNNQQINNCCQVLHPKQCYIDDTGNKRCFIRRHRECSNLCTSSVVFLQPRENARSGCHYIQNYPYVYCGNYERQNCGGCSGQGGECSESCKNLGPLALNK